RAQLTQVESQVDDRLVRVNNTMNLVRKTRGLYLKGIGVIFTTEVDVVRPDYNPFFPLNDQQKAEYKDRKIASLPLLRSVMKKAVVDLCSQFTTLPPDEQVVVSVLIYRYDWDQNVPVQMVAQGTKSKIADAVKAGPAALDAAIQFTEN